MKFCRYETHSGYCTKAKRKTLCTLSCSNSELVEMEEVKTAEWLKSRFGYWECSNCWTLGSPRWKRCPVCEAKMKVEVKE